MTRIRREPPVFRPARVAAVEPRSPWMVQVTIAGPALEGLGVDEPAASVRLLLPSPGTEDLVVPEWNGNEFLLPDGSRPAIRTLTPSRKRADARELVVSVVLHDAGVASAWAADPLGAEVALSGPGRGYAVDPDASDLLLAGDESAIPAIEQLLEVLPAPASVQVHVEVAHPDARLPLDERPGRTITWHDLPPGGEPGDTLVHAARGARIDPTTWVWAAGEAAAMQRIRKHLFDECELPRPQAVVRGYWKRGRGGDADG
ncbi:MAG TPA: siderophore-interacting protein [Acidimicrobiia bacterium]